ncbi:hypothetical protein [Nonomuraea roseola]|uniref:Tyr recombinase domain-containing protein n=1 Tax=Nonomuraea roseola TaxID=46179 RepID=A0ABV5PVE6_9ACTN
MRASDVEPQPGRGLVLAHLVPGEEELGGPVRPGRRERRRENVDRTKAVSKTTIDRLLSRRDLPLREKTLYRLLYETAASAAEILSLNVEDLDLENRRAPLRSKGGDVEWVYWDAGTARLLPRLLRLPDGHPPLTAQAMSRAGTAAASLGPASLPFTVCDRLVFVPRAPAHVERQS